MCIHCKQHLFSFVHCSQLCILQRRHHLIQHCNSIVNKLPQKSSFNINNSKSAHALYEYKYMQIAALFSIQINKTQQTKKHTRSQFPEKESAPDLYKKKFSCLKDSKLSIKQENCFFMCKLYRFLIKLWLQLKNKIKTY